MMNLVVTAYTYIKLIVSNILIDTMNDIAIQ